MLELFIFALWFFLPAGIANVTPIFVAKMPLLRNWNTPLDFGRSFRSKRIFGANKTWRGLLTGVLAAVVVFGLQKVMYIEWEWVQNITMGVDYHELSVWAVGAALGTGALAGDAIESFFKRQLGIPPGNRWFPFDQLDYVLGGLLLVLPFVRLSIWQYMWIVVVWVGVHLVASFIGFKVKLKERPL
jgi:CDP-2,3-bis-(O-geranylgeranyl)-sn-glycerol synthase